MGSSKLIVSLLFIVSLFCASLADAQTGTSPALPGKIVGSRFYKNGTWVTDTQVIDFLNNTDIQRLGQKVTIKSTARFVNVKDKLTNICKGTVDGRSTVNTLVNTSGEAAGGTLFIPSGCKILLSNPGSSNAALNVATNTTIECEDQNAGFVLARRYCSTGDTIGGQCNSNADCPSGGTPGAGTCSTDAGLGTSNAVGNAPFAGTDSTLSYTVLKTNSGASVHVKNCSFWVNQFSGDYTWTSSANGNGNGSGKAWGYCEGGTADTGNCGQYCSSGTFPGQACNVNGDCIGGGTCQSTSQCKTAGSPGSCVEAPTTGTDSQLNGPSGNGKITVIDNSAGGPSAFNDLTIWNHRRGDYAVRLGKDSYAENIITYKSDLTAPISGSFAAWATLPSTSGATVNTGMELSDNSLAMNCDSYGWDNSYSLIQSFTALGFASVAFSRAFSLGTQNDTSWNGTVGFKMGGLNSAAYFNDIYTFVGAKAEPGCNHPIFKGNNHDILSVGAKGPTWIATGPHNDVELNRSAWSALGFIYSFGEIRGKCSSGGTRTNKVCLIPAGTTADLGCPGGGGATCQPNPVLTNAGGGHGYFSNNFLHSDQKGPTASSPGGLAAYVGVTPWGSCDSTSTLPYKTCSTGDSNATTGCPGSSYASAGLACGELTWPTVLFNNNEFYALQEGVTGMDLSGATKLGFISDLNFDGNLITSYNSVSGNTTGFKGPTTAYQLQNANIASHFDRTLSTPISGFDFTSGTTQNSTGLQAANDQGTVITLETAAANQIPQFSLVQPDTSNSSKIVKTATTTPGAAIGIALNASIGNPSGACTATTTAGTSTYANSTTYYFVYTWATASGETLQSTQCSVATDSSASGEYIRVTANEGSVPAGAYAMKVYVGTSNGGPYYYSMSVVGRIADTTTPPNTNNVSPPSVSSATQVRVMTSGLTNCIAGGTISRGDYLTGDSTTAGRVMTTAAGALPVVGKAAAPATSGNTFRCFIGGGSGAIASGGTASALDTTDGTDGTRGFRLKDNSSNPTAPSSTYSSFFTKGLIPYVLQNSSVATPGSYLPMTQFKQASQTSRTTNTLADITGLTGFRLDAAGLYRISGTIVYTTGSGTADLNLGINAAQTPQTVLIHCWCLGAGTAYSGALMSANATAYKCSDNSGAQSNQPCSIDGYIKAHATTGGALAIQLQPNANSQTVTVEANSFVTLEKVAVTP